MVDFIKISIKYIKSNPAGINLVKVIKLDKEIIEILIISTHSTLLIVKLLHLARNKLKFQYIPSKNIVYKQVATLLKVIWQNFAKIHQKLSSFSS